MTEICPYCGMEVADEGDLDIHLEACEEAPDDPD